MDRIKPTYLEGPRKYLAAAYGLPLPRFSDVGGGQRMEDGYFHTDDSLLNSW
jgi:hypothetical protein